MSRSAPSAPASSWRRHRLLRRGGLVAIVALVTIVAALLVRADVTSGNSGSADVAGLDAPADERGGHNTEPTPAPEVTFEQFDSGAPAQLSDWEGRAVVVNFWASWCPPCVEEMREAFEPLHQDLGDQIVFLGVNLQDSEADALGVIERTGVTYELARDPDGELFTALGGFGMPTTTLLDRGGHVVATHTGALTRGQLEAFLVDNPLDG